jgi:hypothetical protein
MSDWKDQLPFLTASKPVTKTIQGSEVKFYPVSVAKAFKLKSLAGPIGNLVNCLGQKNLATGSETQRFVGEDGEPGGEIFKAFAIDPVLEEQQAARRSKAIQDLIVQVTNKENYETFAEILMDSMKDVFPRGDRNNPPPQAFLDSVPLPVLPALVAGLIDANKEVFGSLGEKLQGVVRAKLGAAMDDMAAEPETETPGSNSPTTSNGSEPEVMPSTGSSTSTSPSSPLS